MLRELPVEQLRFGMYVSKLDRPWVGTPFQFQGFVLDSEGQLAILRKLCKTVFVDPERDEIGMVAGVSGSGVAAAKQASERVRGDTVYPELASLEEELPRARTLYVATRTKIQDVVGAVGTGKVLEGPRLKEAVTHVTDSVVRNPDAMMLLSKMLQRGSTLAARALDVSIYMVVFGRFLQLPREQLETLGLLGLLQDIGKLKLPGDLLDKTTTLTREEFERVKAHVAHTVEMLHETEGLPAELPELATLHHERQDGSGYPKGLKGTQIGMIGAIAGIVDTFDALTVPRPYAPRVSPSNALNAIYKGRGTLFHAALVEQFIQCIGIFPVGSVVELNSGEVGVVIAQNLVRRLQPRVMVVQDAKGNPVRPHKILDLMKDPLAGPDKPYRIVRALEYDKVKIDSQELFL